MKRYKKIIAILLSLALIISTFGIFEVSAATKDTRYSKKYLQKQFMKHLWMLMKHIKNFLKN